jgi:hypothetical protein
MENTHSRHKIEPISENFRLKSKKKFMILNHLTGHDRKGKKNHLTLLSL